MSRSLHARELHLMMAEHRQKLVDAILYGAPDYAAYRQLVGQVQAIDDVIKLSEQADSNIIGGATAA